MLVLLGTTRILFLWMLFGFNTSQRKAGAQRELSQVLVTEDTDAPKSMLPGLHLPCRSQGFAVLNGLNSRHDEKENGDYYIVYSIGSIWGVI